MTGSIGYFPADVEIAERKSAQIKKAIGPKWNAEYYLRQTGGRRGCPHPVHRFAQVPGSPASLILPECAGQEAWLAARQDGIGGSEVGALVGISDYETPFSVWNTKKHGGKDLSGLAAVEWGHRLEEVVAQKIAENIGMVSRFAGGLWADRERPILRVTPDRFATKPRAWKAQALIECKGLPLGTPIPVPSGWSSIEAIQPGDQLFAADGKICQVTGKSEVRWVDCYRLTFDDGVSIVCDADHRWPVMSGDSRRPKSQVLNTRQIAESLVGKNGQKQHRILLAGALDLPEDDLLPVEPYTLGCWLGDGSAASGRITKPDQEMFDHITAASGLEVAPVPADNGKCPTRTVYGLVGQLRMADVLGNKHIPARYLRASREQRMALLQGLMDSDGTSAPTRKQVVFSSVHKQMALDFEELAFSLGERPVMVEINGTGFGKPVTSWRVQWRPTKFNPFRVSRKAGKTRIDSRSSRSGRRMIVSAEPTSTVPTQCLMVDSVDHTYLCDRTFLPTHNTAGDDEYWEDGAIWPGARVDLGKSEAGVTTGSAPLSYQAQAQWQMGIIGLDVCYLGCLVLGSERQFFTVEIHRDREWFKELADEAERFWVTNVLGDEPPMHNLRHPKTEELLKQLHPNVIRPSVDLPEDAVEWAADYKAALAASKEADRRLDEIKNYFRMHVGDAGAGYLGAHKLVSYPEVSSSRIDVTALKELYPEIAEAMTVKSHYRRMTIRPPKAAS